MKTLCQRLRWVLLTAALLGGFGLALANVQAQAPSARNQFTQGVPRKHSNKKLFQLPIQIDNQSRHLIQKVILFVRENGGLWQKADEADPSRRYFTYQAPRDGEYWFSVVTVDKQGKSYPADVTEVPPNLIVVVETQSGQNDSGIIRTNHTEPSDPQGHQVPAPIEKTNHVSHLPRPENTIPQLPQPDTLPQSPPPSPSSSPDQHGGPLDSNVTQKNMSTAQGLNRQIISTMTAAIDYRIDKVGPSGVSKIDVWVKAENTSVWQKLATDTDRQSPAQVTFPTEGVYGIRLAVTNGNGFGGQAPKATDEPSFYIEVDTTSPFLQLRPIDSVTTGGAIEIKWSANDKNLADQPISLFYATRQGGPWYPITRGTDNTGSYMWQFPRNTGSQFFIRIEAVDAAGNRSRVESQSPIVLDLTEPAASVVGVSGVRKVGGQD